jgi:hypothetical protein
MKLNLTVEGRVLASVPVDPSSASNDYYLKALRRLLLLRNGSSLGKLGSEPSFCLDHTVEIKRPPMPAA